MITLTDVYKKRNLLEVGPLSMRIPSGTILLVTGENSGGKSSLLKLLAGAITPDSGTLNRSGLVGYLPDKLPFPPDVTAINLEPAFDEFYPNWDSDEFNTLLASFKISRDALLSTLSKGQQKLFMLSIVKASKPDIIIMDEPTNGLDSKHRSKLMETITVAAEKGATVVIASNDIAPFESVASQCLMMNKGKVVLHEDTESLFLKYRLWRGNRDEYNALDSSIIASADQKNMYIECLVTSPIGDMTDLETILINLRKGIRI